VLHRPAGFKQHPSCVDEEHRPARVGAFSFSGPSEDTVMKVNSHIRPLIRANYSSPPLEGAAVVSKILDSPELYRMWVNEIGKVRELIETNRKQIVRGLEQ